MKNFMIFLCAGSLLLLLSACPVSTAYPLSEAEKAVADSGLCGIWYNDSADADAQEVEIVPHDRHSMLIRVLKKGSMYMAGSDSFRAWTFRMDAYDYLILQEFEENVPVATYYVYQYNKDGNTLSTHDITLKVGGTDAVTSVESYQKEVQASSKQWGFLSSRIVWKKRS